MEQKKKRSPWRFAFMALAVVSGLELLGYLASWVIANVLGGISFNVTKAASIGIIGGADGPTSVFVTASAGPAWQLLLWLLLLATGILGWRHFSRR